MRSHRARTRCEPVPETEGRPAGRRARGGGGWVRVGAALLALLAARGAGAVENDECLACHSDPELTETDETGAVISLHVDEQKYARSIHGALQCTGCHTTIEELPHAEQMAPVSCGQCHRLETEIYLASDHGMAVHDGVAEAASCQSCHGRPHELLNYRDPSSPVHRRNIPATCAACHGNLEEMEKFKLRQRAVVVTYEKSVHGLAHAAGNDTSAVCSDCHGTHDLHRSTNAESKLHWRSLPGTCGKCHENVRQTFLRSVHGQALAAGRREAPSCTDCHGEHTISAVQDASARVSPAHIPETCGRCHGAEQIASRYELLPNVVETYMQSYHGLALQFGGLAAAHCASCHGFHDVLPSADPRSSVNKQNLPQTCGKCHPAIGTRLAASAIQIHALPERVEAEAKTWVVDLVRRIYVTLIVVVIGGMVAHNVIDYVGKVRAHVRAVRVSGAGELRLSRLARAQHFALMTLFIVLAYTGFCHKYPDAVWSWPFHLMREGNHWRGFIHRVAGWAFAGLFLAHVVGLIASRRGRYALRVLCPSLHDFADFGCRLWAGLRGRQADLPRRRFNYVEKAEYWALIWGSAVMILTGLALIFTEVILRHLPGVWVDVAQVIHFYEAVLATLAIIIWHFYAVMFDPHEYPMNPAWLIGRKPAAPEAGSSGAHAGGDRGGLDGAPESAPGQPADG